MTTVRLAPVLLLALVIVACGSTAPTGVARGSPPAMSEDVEEVSFEISALM
jgi:hypothetical protein